MCHSLGAHTQRTTLLTALQECSKCTTFEDLHSDLQFSNTQLYDRTSTAEVWSRIIFLWEYRTSSHSELVRNPTAFVPPPVELKAFDCLGHDEAQRDSQCEAVVVGRPHELPIIGLLAPRGTELDGHDLVRLAVDHRRRALGLWDGLKLPRRLHELP